MWRRPLAWVAAGTTLLTLFFSLQRLYTAWSDARSIDAKVGSVIATARTLAEVANYRAAWSALEDAQAVDPTDPRIGATQIEVAAPWLLSAGTPIGWVPSRSASAPEPADSPGTIADTVYVSLVTASLAAQSSDRANLEALAAWARYLRGRELLTRRLDLAPALEAALSHDDHAYYPNLFLAFWRTAIELDPAAGNAHWAFALEAERRPELPRIARSMQLYTLGERIRSPDAGHYPGAAEGDRAARIAYIRALNEMREGDEPESDALRDPQLVSVYLQPHRDQVRFEEMFEALPPQEQLTAVTWLLEAMERRSDPSSGWRFTMTGLRLVRGLILEAMGRREEAVSVIATARESDARGHRELIDEAWTRLTGEAVVPAEKWAAHAHHLRTAALSSPEVRAALEDLDDARRFWLDSYTSGDLMEALELAIGRLTEALAAAPDASPLPWASRKDVENRLLAFRHFHAARNIYRWHYDEGTREIETLLADPAFPAELRARALWDLVLANIGPPRAQFINEIRDETSWEVAMVYLSESIDRLGAALDAGWSDWDEIERLTALREHPSYAALSLRYGRVPPRAEEEQ